MPSNTGYYFCKDIDENLCTCYHSFRFLFDMIADKIGAISCMD